MKRTKNNKADKEALNIFFDSLLMPKTICAECGCTIYNPTRANIAHVLPKSIFKSVATNKHNFIYLCLSDHADFDSSYSKATKMKCWPLALEKYKLFKDEILEYHKFLNYFNE